jgi:hypothetical protein
MKLSIRYVLLFSGALIAGVYLHEIGHTVVGWIEGVAIVPTPAKEYVLQTELDWHKEIWIALGGPIGTTVAALTAALYFWRKPSPESEAILFGAFLPLGFYSLRFLVVGRGHDGLEWQAAQTALGLRPAGHTIDVFFLCLFIAGLSIWVFRLHPTLRTWLRLATMVICGVVLLIVLQVGNNAVFDHRFPIVKIVNVPAGLGPR